MTVRFSHTLKAIFAFLLAAVLLVNTTSVAYAQSAFLQCTDGEPWLVLNGFPPGTRVNLTFDGIGLGLRIPDSGNMRFPLGELLLEFGISSLGNVEIEHDGVRQSLGGINCTEPQTGGGQSNAAEPRLQLPSNSLSAEFTAAFRTSPGKPSTEQPARLPQTELARTAG